MPGPIEMIILAGMGLVLMVALVFVLIVVLRSRSSNRGDDQYIDHSARLAKCPKCGQPLVPGVAACQQCSQTDSA